MKKFLIIILIVGTAVGGVYFFAPERLQEQMSAAAGFLGKSASSAFSVTADTAGGAKKFVLEKSGETKEKAEEIIDPKSPREKREELLTSLDKKLEKIDDPQISLLQKQKLAEEARVIVEEVKKNNEDDPGFLSSIVGVIKGDSDMCKVEE